MAKRVGVDKWLFGVVLLLVLFGLVMVFSASAVMAQSSLGSPYPYVVKQAMWALLGLLAMVVLMRVDYRRYNNPKVVFPAVAMTTLLLVGVFAMPTRTIRIAGSVWGSLRFSRRSWRSRCWCCFWRTFCRRAFTRWMTGRERCCARSLPPLLFIGADLEGAGPGHGAGVHGGDDG
jgi:hypothetical protein